MTWLAPDDLRVRSPKRVVPYDHARSSRMDSAHGPDDARLVRPVCPCPPEGPFMGGVQSYLVGSAGASWRRGMAHGGGTGRAPFDSGLAAFRSLGHGRIRCGDIRPDPQVSATIEAPVERYPANRPADQGQGCVASVARNTHPHRVRNTRHFTHGHKVPRRPPCCKRILVASANPASKCVRVAIGWQESRFHRQRPPRNSGSSVMG